MLDKHAMTELHPNIIIYIIFYLFLLTKLSILTSLEITCGMLKANHIESLKALIKMFIYCKNTY